MRCGSGGDVRCTTRVAPRVTGALGNGRADGAIPAIAGQNYTYLVGQMNGFAAGHRSKADPAVIDAVSKLAPDDMKAVADFMSRLPQSADARYGEVL